MFVSVTMKPASLSRQSCSAYARRGATARTKSTDSESFSHGAGDRHEQRLDVGAGRHVERVARVVDRLLDQEAQVGHPRQVRVDLGVQPAVRPHREAGRREALPGLHRGHRAGQRGPAWAARPGGCRRSPTGRLASASASASTSRWSKCSWVISTASTPSSASGSLNAPGSMTSTAPSRSIRTQECAVLRQPHRVPPRGREPCRWPAAVSRPRPNRDVTASRPPEPPAERESSDDRLHETWEDQMGNVRRMAAHRGPDRGRRGRRGGAGRLRRGQRRRRGLRVRQRRVGRTGEGAAPRRAPGTRRGDAGAGQDSAAGEAPASAPAKAPGPASVAADERSIIYTGSITVRVTSRQVDEAAAEAIAIVTDGRRLRRRRQAHQRRRPLAGVADAAGAGRQVHRRWWTSWRSSARRRPATINTEDVTEQVVDLDARIATQQASVEPDPRAARPGPDARRDRVAGGRAGQAGGRAGVAAGQEAPAGRPDRAVHDHADAARPGRPTRRRRTSRRPASSPGSRPAGTRSWRRWRCC